MGIGLPLEQISNDGNGSASGHVRVYEYSGGSWSQLGSDIDGEAAYDNFVINLGILFLNSDGIGLQMEHL